MPTIYYLIRSRIDNVNGQKLQFNVLNQDDIPQSTLFTVDWDQPDQASPGYSEPSNPALVSGNIVFLALSKSYCIDKGFLTVGLGKRPDYLGTDGPSGGWYVLPSLRPKSLTLETHDGTILNLLDDTLVMPGGISSADTGLCLVISSGAKAMLGVAGALDPYVEPAPAEPSGRGPVEDVDKPIDGRNPEQPKRPTSDRPSTPSTPSTPEVEAETRQRLSELFFAIGRVLEVPQK